MEISPFRTLCEEVENSLWFNFSKDKYEVLPWGKHNPGMEHKLGFTHLGSSSVERDLGFWCTTSSTGVNSVVCKERPDNFGFHQKEITSRA